MTTQDLFFRTEDLKLDEIPKYFVETSNDRQVINSLKGRSPIVLRGSRGVGKSFLLRVAEVELKSDFEQDRILPVYLTFARAGLINQPKSGFLPWMISKVANGIRRALTNYGLSVPNGSALASLLAGNMPANDAYLEQVESQFEEFWRQSSDAPDVGRVPDPAVLREAIEELCEEVNLNRVCLLVDEAAHVFIPEQQRQFFTMMRDLRSPYVAVKAAVYPGATAYGETFQPSHDATVLDVERSVLDESYAAAMREIVFKQDSSLRRGIEQAGEVFDTLAFSATGNPRILLKTLARSSPINTRRVTDTIREYYREGIWSDHSMLAERYPGHRPLIDWGRSFMESEVLPALHKRNVETSTEMSSSIWIHRDAPQVAREALGLLCYSGILQEGVSGIRATRSEVGTRYIVNIGCNIAQDNNPIRYGQRLRRFLGVRRMQEFGANHPAYRTIEGFELDASSGNSALAARLEAGIDQLDLTPFQRTKLTDDLSLRTIGDVLAVKESDFKVAHYVGDVRARQMRNAAIQAVIEYLSG